jgi:hypothetical protein
MFYTANSAARAGAADTVALMIPCIGSFVERGNWAVIGFARRLTLIDREREGKAKMLSA